MKWAACGLGYNGNDQVSELTARLTRELRSRLRYRLNFMAGGCTMKLRYFPLLVGLIAAWVAALHAAILISTASGNINATGTWSVVDATSYLNSETGSTALNGTTGTSSAFTPGAITISGLAPKLVALTSNTGTLKIELVLAGVSVSGTAVTVNCADLPSAAAATAEGGFVVTNFPNVLLLAATAYNVKLTTAGGCNATFWTDGTSSNWSRMITTNGTQVNGPGAGDQFYVSGSLTGAGTHNGPFTVTINTTANINYGNVANTTINPSIAIGQFGVLAFGSSASTAYLAEFAGAMVIYSGGTFTVGTSGTPIPSTSSVNLTLNSTVEGDTGIVVRNGGTFDSAGSAGGRTVVKTLLDATATGASTSTLTVADSTGWLSGDSIIIAGTITTGGSDATSKWDAATLTSDAAGTSVPLTGAVTNTHTSTKLSYTSTSTGKAYSMNMSPAVILLNRNVTIKGSGTTTNGYMYFQAAATGAIDWTEFTSMSGVGGTVQKRGLEVDVGSLGSFSLTNSSFHDSHNTSFILGAANANFGGTAGSNLSIQNNVMYNTASTASGVNYGFAINPLALQANNPYWKVDNLTVIRSAYATFSANAFYVLSGLGQLTNIAVSGSGNGSTSAGTILGPYGASNSIGGGAVGNAWGPLTFYTNVGYPLNFTASNFGISGTISGVYLWHEQGRFEPVLSTGDLILDPFYEISVSFGLYYPSGGGGTLTVRNGVIGWDANSSNWPLVEDSKTNSVYFDNMDLCPLGALGGVTFITCAPGVISLVHDVSAAGGNWSPTQAQVYLRNSSILTSSLSYPSQHGEEAWYGTRAFIVQDCAACSPVKHGAWVPGGFLSYDTAISHSSGFSLRMTPAINTVSGYISSGSGSTAAGTTLTLTSGTPAVPLGDVLTSNGGGYVAGTYITAGSASSYTVSQKQSVGSAGSPVQFQSYNNSAGSLLRLQSAPFGYGMRVGVANGQTAQVCVWIRPSISTDAAPTWGGSAVTYNGDNPRMIVRQNPNIGVQSNAVITTTFTPALTAGAWSQMCGTTPTASTDGEFEIVIDADQTFTSNAGGSVNVAEWSCSTTCGSPAGMQFWNGGAPFQAIVPIASKFIGG